LKSSALLLPKTQHSYLPIFVYIGLPITENLEKEQKDDVFAYLINDIGESLDAYRSPIDENDLKDMVRQFKYFMADKVLFEPLNIKCKKFNIEDFQPEKNWCIDKWWSKEEKIELGIEDSIDIIDVNEFKDHTEEIAKKINTYKSKIADIDINLNKEEMLVESFKISSLFNLKQGDSYYTQKRIRDNSWQGEIPVYSSNTKENGVLIYIDETRIKPKDKYYDYCLTWAVDGTSAGHLFVRNTGNDSGKKSKKFLFTFNNHCGIMIPKEKIEFYLDLLRQNKFKVLSTLEIHNYLFQILEKCPNKNKKEITSLYFKIFGIDVYDKIAQNDLTDLLKDIDFCDTKIIDNIINQILPITTKYFINRIELDLDFISRNAQPLLFQLTRSYRNHKVGTGQIVDVELNVPIHEDGRFNRQKMMEIVTEQIKLENIKNEIANTLKTLTELNVVI
jgi:hypothetical protein